MPCMYSQFCDKYLHWAHVTKATIEMNQLKEVVNAVLEQKSYNLPHRHTMHGKIT